MVYSTSDSITDQTYSVTSVVVDPSQAQLQAVPGLVRTPELAPDLQLPPAYRTSALKELAASNTAGQTTEFAKVNALATWLSGPQFTYSLAPAQPTSAPSLVNFLTKGKSGYCVHYAYAMTVLTRLLGIPARFVVGYTAGTRQKDGSYVVSTADSHAWTEVYFPSMGWIRFEPTPAGQGTANTPDYMTGGARNGQGGGAAPAVSATQKPSALKTPPPVGGLGIKTIRPDDTAGGLVGSAKRAGTPWTAVALAVIAALVLALGLISVVAGPSQHLLAGHPGVLRRRPRTATVAIVGVAAAALVALALYRLLARTSGLNLGVGWATVGIAFGATAAVALISSRRVPPGAASMAVDAGRRRRRARPRRLARIPRRPRRLRRDQPPQRATSYAGRPRYHHAGRTRRRGRHPPGAGRGAGQLRRPSHRITEPAPGRHRRTPRPGRERTPVDPLARDRLPRLDDDRPGPSGGADSRPDHDAEVQAPHAVKASAGAPPVPRGRQRGPLHPAALLPAPPPLFHPLHHPGPPGLRRAAGNRRGLRVQAAPGP